MKIAIFTDSFFPGIGGTERAVLGLADELVKDNQVVVFCPKYGGKVEDNYNFQVIRCNSVPVSANDRMAFPCFSYKYRKAIKDFAPDIIHCQSVSGIAKTGLNYAKKHNIPVVFTVHTKFKTAFANSIKSKLIVNTYINMIARRLNKTDLCCTVSYDMIDELKGYGVMSPVNVVKNGMAFERKELTEAQKNLAKEKYNISQDKINFLFVGRIIKVKNIDLILKTLQYLNEKNIDFQMIFVGIGQDLEYYKNKVKELNLQNKVIFTGSVDDDLLKSIYYNSDLFLFPSIFDNDPLVVVESALFDVPSLTLKGTGSSERIVDGDNGFVAEDEDDFILRTEKLAQDKNLLKLCGQKANQTIPKEWSLTAEEYLAIYQQLIQLKGRILEGQKAFKQLFRNV